MSSILTPLKSINSANFPAYTDTNNSINNGSKESKRNWCRIFSLVTLVIAINAIIIASLALTQNNNHQNLSNIEEDTTSLLCVWNATNNSYVNGQYLFNGVSLSGYPKYLLSLANSCNINGNRLYLFNSIYGALWTIASSDDTSSSNTTSVIGTCKSNTISDVTKCYGLWEIPTNNPQTNVVTMYDLCPSVSCDEIIVRYEILLNDEVCIGAFQKKISSNVYERGEADLYLYFNPSLFRWVCGNKEQMEGCTELNELKGYSKKQSWYEADKIMIKNGRNISMEWSNGHQATFECIINPTKAPTPSPSPRPTPEPTPKPTHKSTSGCYDVNSLIQMQGNTVRSMRDMKVGDYVSDGDGYSKVFYIDEQDPHILVEMNKISFGNGEYNDSLTLTPEHLLYKQGYKFAVRSGEIKIGDALIGDNDYTVYDVSIVYGIPISPITNSGNLMVNGVKTSVYSYSMEEHDRLHKSGTIFRWISNNIDEQFAVNAIDFYYHIIYKSVSNDVIKSWLFGNSVSANFIIFVVPVAFMYFLWKICSFLNNRL